MNASLPTGDPSAEIDEAVDESPGTLRLLLRNPISLAGCVVLVAVVAAALFGPLLAPYGVNDTDITRALQGPSSAHWFGTDDLGRDQFSRVLVAARVSMEVALVSVGISLVAGVTIGLAAGFLAGKTDSVLMRIVDVLFAFPVLLLALAIVAVLGPGLTSAMIAIGVVYTPIFARVTRASTLSVRTEPYVQASRTMGTGNGYIVWHHVLPNISGPVIVQTSLSLAFAILSEAALSFLGLGVQPPRPSWGRMLFDAQDFIGVAWWMSVFPGLAILVTTLAFNLLGDGLGQVLDPQRRTALAAQGGGRR
ncbi:ABC transporter permease [Solicola gregarius]|uniref:ABC transporter permease n=1 Tax=Solicola gregarius TaxID=2908642 RepID=A0AA46YMM9_9ACTN|nr:ABC transporter permease [Solicola gregarius]UYM06671.1 ABC transporter permease [Solicola gregarius]